MKCSAPVLFFSSSIIGLLMTSYIGAAQGNSCPREWFGSDCQYKCRCRSLPCSNDGTCTNGGKCKLGWFGPACQYADLGMNNSVSVTSDNNRAAGWVFDGDDSTCNNDTGLKTVTIDLTTTILFTWMRIAIKDYGSQTPLLIQLNLKDNGGNLQNCANQSKSEINNKTVDIYCEMISNVTQIVLSGEGVKSLCSVHINGGRNIALKQKTSQSSTYISTSYPPFNSSNAVDGNTSGFISKDVSSCTHTNSSSTIQPPYWMLQFREPHIVYRYAVYNRNDSNGGRLKGFCLKNFNEQNKSVTIYHADLSKYQEVYKFLNTVPDFPVMMVNISVVNSEKILTLCEVEIYGDCMKGSYGLACDQCCSQNCGGDGSCQLFGNCLFGCKPGYQGSKCNNNCPEGQYGFGCSKKCSGNCASDQPCHHVNGTCLFGCKAGYKTHLCNENCPKGQYGFGCSKKCSGNCASDESCYHVNGTCLSGCKAGYKTHLCNENCPKGQYGFGCSKKCSGNCASDESCYHVNGTCLSGCKAGYKTHLCNENCPKGQYGFGCSKKCSGNCASDESCYHVNGTCLSGCKAGYKTHLCNENCPKGQYGFGCSKKCSGNCASDESCYHVNGTCLSGCKAGYKTHLCNENCPKGQYGFGCSKKCSGNCASDESCYHVNGTCLSGCKAGYKTHLCNENCPKGQYGFGCSKKCSGNCASDESCYHVNGTCLSGCKAGYKTHLCNETCPEGQYGLECSEKCSGNCASDEPCHHVNGTCLSGCKAGYKTHLCNETLKEPDESPTSIGAIVGSVIAVIVIAVLIFLGVMLWKRRESPKSQGQHARSQPDGGDITLSPIDQRDSGLTGPSSTEADRKNPQSGPYYNTLSPQETAIAVDKLGAFLFSHRREFYAEQFNAIPTTTNAVMTSGLSDENRVKNRYKNICPYDHSRVLLKANPSKKQGDYINACYVGGYKNAEKFIASQGPNNTIMEDFIRMLWEQKVEKVVMLTNLVEEGKSKCDRYWPEERDIKFGDFKVILTTTQVFADYTIRKLHLAKEGFSTVHEFTHFHFTAWPDKGVPLASWGLVDFEQRVFSSPSTKPIVVHCSAGVGRTGTFIALRNIMREAKETGQVDFYSTLWKLRQERMLMIQTLDQYIFLHRAAQVALVCTGTTVTAENITERMKVLQEKSASGETNMEREFREICSLCADYETGEEENDDSEFTTYDGYDEDSLSAANKDKNRFCDVLPKKRYKTYIQGRDNTYINAVQVQSFTKQHQNILTQLPLPTTVTDFWSLVTQYKVSLIVAFEIDSKSTDETIGEYYPSSEGELVSASHFKIHTGPAQIWNFWTVQQLTVTSDKTDVHRVTHVKPTFTDLNPEKLLALVTEIRNNTPPGDGRTVYMCRNGAQYSGLVCVLSLLLDRMDNDNCLNVPLVVGAIKSIRPQVIPTLEQYQALYKVLQDFSEESNVYFNVGESQANGPAVGSFQEYENVYANT